MSLRLGPRATGEGKSVFFVRFTRSDLDLYVRCPSGYRMSRIGEFLDDEDPQLPAGAVDFCPSCQVCDPPMTVGERFELEQAFEERPSNLLRQWLTQISERIRRRLHS